MNRFKIVSVNIGTTFATQLVALILKFAVQTIFIQSLGKNFIGLNGLFTNVLSFLSFADLGIGAALTASLYKPLVSGNAPELSSLLKLYKIAYKFITSVILVFGVIVSFFVPNMIRDLPFDRVEVQFWFILFLLSTSASYLSAYKRSLLIANQKAYISVLNDFVFKSLQQIAQIVAIVLYANYTLFLIIQILSAVLSNYQISRYVSKQYPQLFTNIKTAGRVSEKVILSLKKNVMGAMSSKIGEIAVFGTDNLLISYFIGLGTVGVYSTYGIVVNSINAIVAQVFNSIVGIIGNMGVSESTEKKIMVYKQTFLINLVVTYLISILLAFGINSFITLWVGKQYLFNNSVMWLIIVNFAIAQLRFTPTNFINAFGLYWALRWKSIIEAGANLVFSLIFLIIFHMGVVGVVLGTLMSNLLINLWWEPYVVFNKGLNSKPMDAVFSYIKYIIVLITGISLFSWFSTFFILTTFLSLILSEIAVLLLGIIILTISVSIIGDSKLLFNLIKSVKSKFIS